METIGNPWLWAGFGGLVVIALLVDLVLMRHGGPHKAESEPDKGSTFRFTLPAMLDNPNVNHAIDRHGTHR